MSGSVGDRPEWFERLGQAYLGGEGALFVVVGGDPAEIEAALVTELSKSRSIVGVVRGRRPAKAVPGQSASVGLTFPKLGDLPRFENLLAGRRVFAGVPILDTTRPLEALGAVWAVLELPEPAQGWIVQDPDVIFPVRKEPEALGGRAPPLAEWAASPRLRDQNHIVVMIAGAGAIHPAVLATAVAIDVNARRPAPSVEPVAEAPPAGPPAADTPPPLPADGAPPVPDLGERLQASIERTLPGWPAASYPSRAPIMAAVADLLAGLPSPPCGPVAVRWDPEAGAVVEGPGAEWFQSRWASDVAVDAAAGMIVKGLQPPEPGYPAGAIPPTDAVGTRVLGRRIERWFTG